MEYYSLNQYLKDIFGCKVYKIALDGGFTCPNRDGSLETRGCIFCSGKGSGNFAQPLVVDERGIPDVVSQIEAGKLRVSSKNPSGKYIAYFQSFTGTYAPVSYLRQVFTQAIEHPDIVALSVGTRPDCLPQDVIELLQELNKKKPVWVELGLQTIHEKTAEYIRRGYSLPVFDDAVKRLREAGMEVVVHCILGLPHETRDMMKETVAYVGKSGAQGIKLQLLHVLKGTDLEQEYLAGKFTTMEMEEYVSLVAECISLLPKDMVIHRMTGDGDKRELIAPLWSTDKKRVLNALQKAIRDVK
ncbi:MAG: TIGR01212 family radical SAM protein [Lachnospiraceae bacterium]|nr:TIGR01212 family radical SAM protein [Lachnospiraceae bacterium]